MDAREETLSILGNVWVKLQGLPQASPVELAAFFVILTFILVVLLMAALTCVSSSCCCCCCRGNKMRRSNI